MHTVTTQDGLDRRCPQAVAQVLREARRLHRAAVSGPLVCALPVLRRLLASGAMTPATLPVAYRQRATLQRKHVLRALAVEAGFDSWQAYRPALERMTAADLQHLAVWQRGPGCLNLWFRSAAEAEAFASTRGGSVVRMGRQAVVLPPASPSAQDGHA